MVESGQYDGYGRRDHEFDIFLMISLLDFAYQPDYLLMSVWYILRS